MINETDILQTLKQIIDPDFNKDIVSLGFVKNIKIEGDKVAFDIALTTPACPIKDEFKTQAEQLVGRLAGVKEVQVNMTTLTSGTSAMAQPSESLKKIRSII